VSQGRDSRAFRNLAARLRRDYRRVLHMLPAHRSHPAPHGRMVMDPGPREALAECPRSPSGVEPEARPRRCNMLKGPVHAYRVRPRFSRRWR